MRVYRMNPTREDPELLLIPTHQWTEPWGGADSGVCDKCAGEGRKDHACWSCLLTAPDPACPACRAAVRWQAPCPVCRGAGEIDGRSRHGVSVLPTIEGLYRYMIAHDADLERCVVAELEALRSSDVDFDADEGALLVIPTRIIRTSPVDRELVERVRTRAAALQGDEST
jgi:hypothetical protein